MTEKHTFWRVDIFCGLMAGAAAATSGHPMDTVRSRYQVQHLVGDSRYKGITKAIA